MIGLIDVTAILMNPPRKGDIRSHVYSPAQALNCMKADTGSWERVGRSSITAMTHLMLPVAALTKGLVAWVTAREPRVRASSIEVNFIFFLIIIIPDPEKY